MKVSFAEIIKSYSEFITRTTRKTDIRRNMPIIIFFLLAYILVKYKYNNHLFE